MHPTKNDLELLKLFQSGEVLNRPLAHEYGFGHCLPDRVHRLRQAGYNIKSWPGSNGYHNYGLDFSVQSHEDIFLARQLSFNFT
ncbi:hypothetical protein PsalBI1_04547 (plasmid) [Piscirickettsia salmonis]|nr:hypothetical protein Psal182_03568 [Piscirickettsia salmonis]QGP57113.1 hypothetical protein PsalSR1_04602 [Piscirickettsia salmonis]QGP61905.1 hypothetical protein PsalBI1_04547 [Piscirickettsia salmonis]